MMIRSYEARDCKYMADLFYHTVHFVNAKDYTKEQLAVWATGKIDLNAWHQSFSAHYTVVAVEAETIIGFGDIDKTGYLDRLYVHRDFQRQGVATAICNALEQAVQADKITTHASITAKPFFEKRGYRVIREQSVERGGVRLTNYVMKKHMCKCKEGRKAMKYVLSDQYDKTFIQENIMGPNPIKLLEELLISCPLKRGSLVLDLGCGRGVTSVFLARELGTNVIAADLWIDPNENRKRFRAMGFDDSQITPLAADARSLNFPPRYFDAVVSIDAYHYFGTNTLYLDKHLLPFVKSGGCLLIAVPGLKKEFGDTIPPEMLAAWTAEDLKSFHDLRYWKTLFSLSNDVDIISIHEMGSFDECWNDWLACNNEYAANDRKAMEAGAGKYMNFIGIILRRK